MKMLTAHSLVWLMSISWGTWELVLYCVLYCIVLYCTWESCSAVEAHTTTVPWAKAPRVAGEEDCESKVQCGSASYLPVLLLAVVSSCALSLKYVLFYTAQLQQGTD